MKKMLFTLLLFITCFAAAFAQGIESGLVAKYCFSGNANDALGARNATVFGATLTTDRFGTPNEAYLLDGIDDYIQMPNDIWVNGNFSFTGWMYLNGQDSWARFFEWGNGIDKDNVFYCPYQSGQMVFSIHQCGSGARTYAYNPSTISTGAWAHIAITLTGDTVRVYRDNVFLYSYKMTFIPCSVIRTECYFGKSNFPNPYLDGKIDDIRIYDRAISVAEIDTIYKLTGCGAFVDPCAGTKADFKHVNSSCYTVDFTDLSVTNDSGVVSWNWSFGDLTTSTLKNPTHTYADYGTYNVSLIIKDSSGCIDTLIETVSINYKHFADAGRDTTVCLKNGFGSLMLIGNGGVSYSWSPSAGLTSPSSKNTTATISTATKYYLTVTDAFGCKDSDTVSINLHPKTSIAVKPDDTAVCYGSDIKLNTTGAKSYQWIPSSAVDSADISNPTALNITGNKTIYVIGTDNNGCVGYDTVNLSLLPSVTITATPESVLACEGDTVRLLVSGGLSYKWLPSEGLSNDTLANPTLIITKSRTYLVKGKAASGCDGFDSVTINLYSNPVVDASAFSNSNLVRCKGDEITLNATGALSYSWSPSAYCANPLSSSTSVYPEKNTVFTVTGISPEGCRASDTISVVYEGKEKVFVPNVFTPNNDQLNDQIGIVDVCNVTFLSFSVYNRWGQKVFAGYKVTDKWDGRYNGQTCEPGTYFYLVRARTLEGDFIDFKGDISLIR